MIRIKHGTPDHTKSMCDTCCYAQKLKGHAESQEYIRCSVFKRFMGFKVAECSNYEKLGALSLWQMQDMAWKICTDKSGKRIGFLSPAEINKRREKGDEIVEVGSPIADQ